MPFSLASGVLQQLASFRPLHPPAVSTGGTDLNSIALSLSCFEKDVQQCLDACRRSLPVRAKMAPDEDDDDDTIAGLLFFMLPSFD